MKIVSLQSITTVRHGASEAALSVVIDDNGNTTPLTINADHPNWNRFQEGIREYSAGNISNEDLANLFMGNTNLVAKAAEKLVKVQDILDGRMTLVGNSILVDHSPIDPALEGHILRLLREDGTPKDARNWRAFAKFVENLYANASEYVREQFFPWMNYENLKGQGFTLTDDGCIIGYKGCAGTPEAPTSINRGTAIVNGVVHNGAIPNPVGAVVEMARTKVQDDPNVGCSTGLHVGTFDYANGFQRGVLVTVKVNPRDIVSVPTECAAQKVRVCRYEVLETVQTAYSDATWGDGDDEDWDDESSDFQVGDEVEFTYRRRDGQVKNYSVRVTSVDSHHIQGENEDGEPRTFLRSRVENLRVAGEESDAPAPSAPAAAPAAAPTSSKAANVADVAEGDVVSFTYRRRDGQVKDYELEVTHNAYGYLEGELTNGGGYRSFYADGVKNLKVVGEGEAADDSAQDNANDATSVQDPADRVRATLDGFITRIGAHVSTVLDDLASSYGLSDEDDPGDEEEQEIRRYGYGDDRQV